MFERYTEGARRTIFFARYEASQYGSRKIETEHLLLGILREDNRLGRTLFSEPNAGESIRKDVDAQTTRGERISTSVEMPLSEDSKRVLHFAADSAERLGHRHVDNVHLVLGILREEGCLAARILEAHGAKGNEIRKKLESTVPGAASNTTVVPLKASAASRQANLRPTLCRFLDAWDTADAGKILEHFEDDGQFWDTRGKLWSGPELQKGIEAHLTAARTELAKGTVEQVLPIALDIAVVTLRWTSGKTDFVQMVAVLHENGKSWRIVSVHLALVETP
jgi:Clp amino terminal domain, pathogenicity island component